MRRILSIAVLASAFAMVGAIGVFAADKGGPKAYQAAAPASAFGIKCYAEVSAAKNVTNVDASGITFGADGLQGGGGLGCDMINGRIVIGILGRYDIADLSGALGGGNLDGDAMWSAALRGGIKLSEGALVYGLIGAAGTKFDYAGLIEPTHRGLMYGAGIEIDVFSPGLSLFAEWNHIDWNSKTVLGTPVEPDTDLFRLGLKLKLNVLN